MMLLILPLFWSEAISAIRMFSSSDSNTLSPFPPATQNPPTPAWILNSITSLKAVSFSVPSEDIGVAIAGKIPSYAVIGLLLSSWCRLSVCHCVE